MMLMTSTMRKFIDVLPFLMPDFDADGDGVISKEEFESGMNK